MRLRAISVRNFRCIASAEVTLHDGLNVLYGPNDLGKSTLVEAIRAALLLQHTSKQGSDYKPWGTDSVPEVELQLTDTTGRWWRVRKAFSTGRRGGATLEWSNDGAVWTLQDKNRGVDGKLRQLLAWGVPDAGVKGGRGAPGSFLATVLVGPQMQPGGVFNTSLATDRSESGRERLTEALQALAEDPIFKEVLDRAQTLVSRAFNKNASKRTGKDSPFRQTGDRIKALSAKLRQLQEQVISSENVRDELGARRTELDAAIGLHAEAVEARVAVDTAWSAAITWKKARKQLDGTLAEVATIEQRHRAMEQLRDEQHELSRDRPAAQSAVDTADEARQRAERAAGDAAREVEEVEKGGDAEGKLHQQSMRTRKLELTAQREKIYERLQRAEAALASTEALEELEDQTRRMAGDVAAATEDTQVAIRARREAEAERKAFDGALSLRRLQDAKARLQEAQDAATEATSARAEATKLSEHATTIEREVADQALPAAAEIAEMREVEQALRLAEARLGGGLSLAVRSLGPDAPQLVVVADQSPGAPATEGATFQADQRMTIRVGPGTVLDVVGGEAETRQAVERAQATWSNTVGPQLTRLDAQDVRAVEALRRAADDRLTEGAQARARAVACEQRAQTYDITAADQPARRLAVERYTEGLAGLDLAQLAAHAGDLDEAALHAKRSIAEARIEEAARTATLRSERLAELKADADAHQRRFETASAASQQLLATLGGDAQAIAAQTRDAHAAVEGKLEQVQDELAEAQRQSAGRLLKAQTRAAQAQQAAVDARTVRANAAARLDEIKARQAGVAAQLSAQEDLSKQVDEPAVRERAAAEQAALDALPPPDAEITEDAVRSATERVNAAATHMQQLEKSLAGQQGELKQVGGNVVLEDRKETEHALAAARGDEAELELDYEAYRLLVEVLRETEGAQGRHLGNVLSGPIRDRFTTLTKGRYGALQLNADLQAQGLEAHGSVRSIDALSAGLQEQLATLLRLSVAEHLDSALVLDDHLTQTDPARIDWFRSALLKTAASTQVVVITCRQEDYLGPDAAVTPHAVNLAQVIERVRSPSPPATTPGSAAGASAQS